MNKTIIATAALAGLLTVAACSSGNSASPAPTTTPVAVKQVDSQPSYAVAPIGSTLKIWDSADTPPGMAEFTVSNPRMEGGMFVVDEQIVVRQTSNSFWPHELSVMTAGGKRVQEERNDWAPDHPDWLFRNTMATGERRAGKVVFDTGGQPVTAVYLGGIQNTFDARWDIR